MVASPGGSETAIATGRNPWAANSRACSSSDSGDWGPISRDSNCDISTPHGRKSRGRFQFLQECQESRIAVQSGEVDIGAELLCIVIAMRDGGPEQLDRAIRELLRPRGVGLRTGLGRECRCAGRVIQGVCILRRGRDHRVQLLSGLVQFPEPSLQHDLHVGPRGRIIVLFQVLRQRGAGLVHLAQPGQCPSAILQHRRGDGLFLDQKIQVGQGWFQLAQVILGLGAKQPRLRLVQLSRR